jgi:hypothetical protein
MTVRNWGVGVAAVGILAALAAAGTAQAALGKKRPPITVETVLGELKVKLIGQGYMSYVVTGRDRRGAETDTPQTDTTTYTDVSWADRCVLKIKSSVSVQDNVDEGWHETHPVEASIDLHDLKTMRAIPYADYLTRKDLSGPKAQPDVRYRTEPHNFWAIPAGDTVLVAKDHSVAMRIIRDLDKARTLCAAEAKEDPKPAG